MADWALEHKETGEFIYVKSLDGYDQDAYIVTQLARAPEEFDEFVDGKLVKNLEKERRGKELGRLAGMSRLDMYNEIQDNLLDKLAGHGIITAAQAIAMKQQKVK